MVKHYEATPFVNRVTSWMARMEIGRTEVTTTIGRKSGESRDVPVSSIVIDGTEYVVSPHGQVGWVHNVRANPMVTLRHGSQRRQVRLEEVTGPSGPPAAAAYHARESFARPYMDVPENPTLEDFVTSASLSPVFRVVPNPDRVGTSILARRYRPMGRDLRAKTGRRWRSL
ncbi:MAG: nitroreductase family deazaflavin-dependent oxidoreductase [Acidimicrobiia bacterium]